MIAFDLNKSLQGTNGRLILEISCRLEKGEFLSIYGPSGAGKTSVLRMLAGLLEPDQGSIQSDESTWYDSSRKIRLPAQKRKIGFVFQDYALFPNMTVQENLEYALQPRQGKESVKDMIEIMELGELRYRKPQSLSGGQRQRAALARALIRKPDLLLLDEPLSALDHAMRYKLQEEILRLHRHFRLTTILVSHDLAEIVRLSDQVIHLDNGQVLGRGGAGEVLFGQSLSGKFPISGEILAMEKEDVVYVLTVQIGNQTVFAIADESEVKDFHLGDKVVIASQAFNPVIRKASR
jgi:molybdate transport system ATP-binding protein